MGDGLLQFKFSLESQLRWVWNNGLWSIDNNILVLRRWEKGLTTRTVSFTSLPMWVQVWGLPFDLINEDAGMDIGQGIRRVVEVDCKALAFKQARFLRVKVEIPLHRLIRKGGQIESLEGDRVRVAYKYERMVGLCFQCGQLGHKVARCLHPYEGTVVSRPYGEWLRAGAKTKLEGSQSRADSPPRHDPTPQPPVSNRVTQIAKTLSAIGDDMADNLEIHGIINADTNKGGKFRIHRDEKDTSFSQISNRMSTELEILKPGPSLNGHALT